MTKSDSKITKNQNQKRDKSKPVLKIALSTKNNSLKN